MYFSDDVDEFELSWECWTPDLDTTSLDSSESFAPDKMQALACGGRSCRESVFLSRAGSNDMRTSMRVVCIALQLSATGGLRVKIIIDLPFGSFL